MDSVLLDSAQRIFNHPNHDAATLWAALEGSELTRAWIPESRGGHALPASDVLGLIELSAGNHISVPFAETLFASWLLSAANLETPAGPLDFRINDFRINYGSTSPACGTGVDHLVVVDNRTVSLYKTGNSTQRAVNSTVTATGDDIVSNAAEPVLVANAACPSWLGDDVALACAAQLRALQLIGAASAALELTLEYANVREQFGRPLDRFQAIQHLLSETAGEVASATAACEACIDTLDKNSVPNPANAAIAKQRCSEAAGSVAERCHQVHGAMGYTQDYPLATLSKRLWQWRDDYGDEYYWAEWLGRQYLNCNTTFWAHLTEPG